MAETQSGKEDFSRENLLSFIGVNKVSSSHDIGKNFGAITFNDFEPIQVMLDELTKNSEVIRLKPEIENVSQEMRNQISYKICYYILNYAKEEI